MSELLFATLYSGSSGNAVYLSCGGDAILIDAGKNTKCLEEALHKIGEDPRKIRAVFVTHEHRDHIAALPVFCKKYGVPAHFDRVCAEAAYVLPQTLVLHDGEYEETVGPFTVSAFFTPHDSARALGFTVTAGGEKFGIATDMGMLAESVVSHLLHCDAALIECNYDRTMLLNGPYSPPLKARVGGRFGHLSNNDGALLAAVLASSGTKDILLGHISRENNTPDKILETVRNEFDRRGVTARVLVADRDDPTVLIRR